MAGPEIDFPVSIRQNSDDYLNFPFATGTPQSATPVDFTGCTACLTITQNAISPSTVIFKIQGTYGDVIRVNASYITFNTVTSGGITFGNIQAFFYHGDTVDLPVGIYYYDLEIITNGSQTVNGYYCLGQFTILPSVSRVST